MVEVAKGSETTAKPIKGAGGVVFNLKGQVLLLHHKNGTWVFPKGHIDPGESKRQAALREVEEEAGVQTWILDEGFKEKTRYTNARGKARVITWFLLGTRATRPLLREVTFPGGGFFKPEKALDKLSYTEDKRLLELMLERYKQLSSDLKVGA